MAVISAVGLPLLQILIRDAVAGHGGMADVGLLQGVVRISDMYLGVATSIFAMYYFPRFSEIADAGELVREAKRGLAIIVPTVAVVSFAIWLLRDLVIRILFTAEFNAMRDLFAWQMLGNTLKMVGWLFGYLLLAKANALAMAALETVTIVVWWLLSLAFIPGTSPTIRRSGKEIVARRRIKAIHHVALCMVPAYRGAQVAAVREAPREGPPERLAYWQQWTERVTRD